VSEQPPLRPDVSLGELVELLAQRVAELVLQSLPAHAGERSPWMGIEQAASYLDWPKQRLYKLTAQSAIPHVKHEGRILFRRDELDAWLAGFVQGGPR